ncbi:MAG: hypothetical protein IK016_08635 [Lachnospiraceae bacterium]|nr:hypothetical protein [Lachnospiraceae bacterium]
MEKAEKLQMKIIGMILRTANEGRFPIGAQELKTFIALLGRECGVEDHPRFWQLWRDMVDLSSAIVEYRRTIRNSESEFPLKGFHLQEERIVDNCRAFLSSLPAELEQEIINDK